MTVSITSGPDLARATHHILVTGELFDAHRAARMEFIGGNADFRAHAEFAAVGELGRGVMQNDGAVDAAEEALGRG